MMRSPDHQMLLGPGGPYHAHPDDDPPACLCCDDSVADEVEVECDGDSCWPEVPELCKRCRFHGCTVAKRGCRCGCGAELPEGEKPCERCYDFADRAHSFFHDQVGETEDGRLFWEGDDRCILLPSDRPEAS